MNIISFLIPCALLLGMGFGVAFIVSTLNGQFDDLETPAHRILLSDELLHDPDLELQTEQPRTKERT